MTGSVFAVGVVLLSWRVLQSAAANAYTAPWCAVISLGPGSVYWDCQYSSFEQCVPNVLAGNRGFCNHNPRLFRQCVSASRASSHRKN